MKYEWEGKDIISGRVVRNPKTKATDNKYMICSRLSSQSGWRFSLVSLTDGLTIIENPIVNELAQWLNEHNYEPTDDDRETTRAIDYLRGVR